MSNYAFSRERSAPVFASDTSSEYAAELTRFCRLPITLGLAASLVYGLLGIPAIGWDYQYRGVKTNVVWSQAITLTGQRLIFPGAIPLVLFVDRNGRITYPVTHF